VIPSLLFFKPQSRNEIGHRHDQADAILHPLKRNDLMGKRVNKHSKQGNWGIEEFFVTQNRMTKPTILTIPANRGEAIGSRLVSRYTGAIR
jgi:hypothetical protein